MQTLTTSNFTTAVFSGQMRDGLTNDQRIDLRLALFTLCSEADGIGCLWEVEAMPNAHVAKAIGACLPETERKAEIVAWLERLSEDDANRLRWFGLGFYFAVPYSVNEVDGTVRHVDSFGQSSVAVAEA
jgi:hypothetical protein